MRILPVAVLATCLSLVAIACGSSGDTGSNFPGGNTDAGEDASLGFNNGNNQFNNDGSTDGPTHSSCVRQTCLQANATCGPIGDGCGGLIDCGTCASPTVCGGGGVPSQCGGNDTCTPKTC